MEAARRRLSRVPGLGLSLLLLTVLVAVNAAAIWGILTARASARAQAATDLELETRAQAHALEATLASLRADVLFLAGSPALSASETDLASDDPLVRRWRRLDVESALLLFVQAHPAVVHLALRDADGNPRVAVARVPGGAPTVLPPDAPTPTGPDRLHGVWSDVALWVDPEALVARASPGHGGRLRLAEGPPPDPGRGVLEVAVPVVDEDWSPPVAWWLVRREEVARRLASVESLAERYRTTVLVNLAVIALTLALASLAFRQIRRAARLEAEGRQAQRVRELERQLFHSERLASVGRLASGIAHEINNPLAGMRNYLDLLRDDLAHLDPATPDVATAQLDAAREHAERLREGIDRAAAITRQVLAFSSPGQAPKSPVALDAVLAETVAFVDSNPAFRDVDVRYDGPAGVVVVGNSTTLGQLFLNLMLNACQVQLEDGEASAGTGTAARARVDVELATSSEGAAEGAVVRVADRGPGVDEEARRHLFEPFYSQRGSTGLGLSVCHGIARDHGGTIEVHDREGGGAVFEVRLPLAPQEAAA